MGTFHVQPSLPAKSPSETEFHAFLVVGVITQVTSSLGKKNLNVYILIFFFHNGGLREGRPFLF